MTTQRSGLGILKILISLVLLGYAFADEKYVEKYAVVVDAGSTGSRAFVFKIDVYPDGQKEFHSTSCGKVNQGLSSFSNNQTGAYRMFSPLLETASDLVPNHLHRETSLYMKGTAGMRLLNETAQDSLWNTLVRDLRWKSGLKFHIDRRNFGTISGHLEAYYAVVASNYIVGSIDGNLSPVEGVDMIGALDMGGSSTQLILFNGTRGGGDTHDGNVDSDTGTTAQSQRVTDSDFWSHSWLRYGVETVRYRVLKRIYEMHISAAPKNAGSGGADDDDGGGDSGDGDGRASTDHDISSNVTAIANPCALKGHYDVYDDENVLVGTGEGAKCVHLIEQILWADFIDLDEDAGELTIQEVAVDGTVHSISAQEKPSLCTAKPCAVDAIEHPPVQGHHFYAMSVYYYALDCVRHFSPTNPLPHWPNPSIVELEEAAMNFCSLDWTTVEHGSKHKYTYPAQLPYRCLEALYIITLLDKGFGFDRHGRSITLALEVAGKEVEWTLGFALSEIELAPIDFARPDGGNGTGSVSVSSQLLLDDLKNSAQDLASYMGDAIKDVQAVAQEKVLDFQRLLNISR
mmetsp:Transcript_1039/g.1717  ORF Transcript_1039/g.1717 Transcript_1039/m.1717 type:complete len:572 (-) Transcript_1039:896-2611(-)|eukprot:CAMPEP_0174982476 /NCGR_PEP_ID=MMETSP0004_2-20121128/16533_1 /TAXON_ID=420556 /ORGANISM="Ochromonas sp., Strain CCMP1393" /LENGTH=571 /DNA_ID=CAMNT_0016234469 /DNA_START=71 /DNA_END=1786 /DNA_ORIENTATION=+